MKITGKILMWISAIIIIAHTVVPHQHKAQLENIIHTCLFSTTEKSSDSSDIVKKLEDVAKHINLGELRLEDFRVSNYEYSNLISYFFDVPPILSFLCKFIDTFHKPSNTFYYSVFYTTEINKSSNGLRAPPSI